MAPLDATRITAEDGLSEARQKGSCRTLQYRHDRAARVRRASGLTLATCSGSEPREGARVGVVEFDGRVYRPHRIRGEFAQVFMTAPMS
jgi:hypothetical protein